MTATSLPRSRERGAILILTSVSMLAMMCFAGLAIDMGMVRSQRAQYQATSDAAALYATYLMRQPGADLHEVAAAVRSFVALNLDLDNGTADSTWADCDDAKKLATVSAKDASIGNDCISFDLSAGAAGAQARVRLPMLRIKPIIGLGVMTMDVTAVAGAEGQGSGCDAFSVAGCATTTTTTAAPTTTAPPTSVWQTTTTKAPAPTTTKAPGPTTTKAPTTTTTPKPTTTPAPTTTKAPGPTTTKAPTTTTTPKPTTTPAPTTTKAPVPTTLDIGF